MKTTSTKTTAAKSTRTSTRSTKSAAPTSTVKRTWSYETMREAISNYKAPAWVSTTVSLVAGLLVAGSSYYAGMTLVNMLMGYAFAVTASAFLVFIIYFLGLIVTLLLSIYAGAQAQQWIVNGGPKAIIAAPARFVAWLGRAKDAVAKTA